jgi:drug/metabolite transporter (DMT)-like permease
LFVIDFVCVFVIGLFGCFAGVGVFVAPWISSCLPLVGVIAILVASALWATGSLVSRSHPLGVDPILGTAMELLAGGALLLLIGGANGEWQHLHPAAVTPRVGFAFAWLVVPGTLVAFSAYLYALRTLPTATVATYAYANPVVAVAIGILLLGEHLHPGALIAGTIIVAAVALTITDQTRKHQPGNARQQTISPSSRRWHSLRSRS